MSSIWSWGRPSKVDCNSTLPWGSLILHILTSLGRFDFWQGKWTTNWKILVGLEIRLNKISNKLSGAQFWHQEGLQKSLEKWCDALGLWHDALGLWRDALGCGTTHRAAISFHHGFLQNFKCAQFLLVQVSQTDLQMPWTCVLWCVLGFNWKI